LQAYGESSILAALRDGNHRRAVELMLDSYQDAVYAYCVDRVGLYYGSLVYRRVLALAVTDIVGLDSAVSVRAWLFAKTRQLIERDGLPRVPGTSELELLEPQHQEILKLLLWHDLHPKEVAFVLGRSEWEIRQQAGESLTVLSGQEEKGQIPS
jgi:hypothetical protein